MNEFNSQACTSAEQSKRLLELGLKPETADCYNRKEQYGFSNWIGKPSLTTDIPAWSLHRLMEISGAKYVAFENVKNAYDFYVNLIASYIEYGFLNKEYLKQ